MRRADKPLFFLGIVFILGGFLWMQASQIGKGSRVVPSPTPHIVVVSPSATASAVLGEARQKATVLRVVDGDTIHVEIDNKEETVRLIGVDTPETVDPRKPVQCFGKEASNFTKQTLSDKTVFLEKDETQGNLDKYQRLLRYIFLEDGTNVNKLLIQEGYAHEYTYHLPYKYQSEFKQAEKEARENNKGLWAVCYTQ